MPISQQNDFHSQQERNILVDFIPAVLKHTKSEGYLIEYHYKDKITNKLIRKRYYLNRVVNAYRKKSDGVNHARRIVHELNEKLKTGWTPIFETENQRLYTPILELRDIYLNNKKRDLRADTMRSYTSMTNIFNEWIEGSNRSGKVTGNFLRYDAICYMDYIYSKGYSNRTYNNTLKGMRTFFSWAVEHCYCKENPFSNIKTKTKEAKKRIIIDEKSRKKISEYLRVKNPQFLIVCQLVYNSAMRPKEIANIQIGNIKLDNRYCEKQESPLRHHHGRRYRISATAD